MLRRPIHFRRLPVVSYLLLAAFILFLQAWIAEDAGFESLLPKFLAPLRGGRGGETTNEILKPFDYVDRDRVRVVPENEPPSALDPYEIAEKGDQRNPAFYAGGTLTLTGTPKDTKRPLPVIYDPYPDYNTPSWREQWHGEYSACEGPRKRLLQKTNPNDMLSVYRGNQRGFPWPAFGSHEALQLDANVCYERCTRLAPYGAKGPGCPDNVIKNFNWEMVNWGKLQDRCAMRNANRYATPRKKPAPVLFPDEEEEAAAAPPSSPESMPPLVVKPPSSPPSSPPPSPLQRRAVMPDDTKSFQNRSAVLLRTHDGLSWTFNHMHFLRSLIMELSLHSGGEFEVFLLVEVKESDVQLDDPASVKRLLKKKIPKEFHDITIIFTQDLLAEWYPGIDEHKAILQHFQPTQIFSHLNPHYDHVWQLEFDARFTGHAYEFLTRSVEFAARQPRKYLWERNAFFYTPGAHGTWDNFIDYVDGALADRANKTVWGPVQLPPHMPLNPAGPNPPVASPADDEYEWGVGEDAEVLTFLPIFDPRDTQWTFPDEIWNVPPELPRRASPVTMWRVSRRLLALMHDELAGDRARAVVSEMTAPTWALLHGFKTVAVPQPLYVDGNWTAQELAKAYNPNADREPELVNGRQDSVWTWNHRMDRIMYRLSYMFATQFAEDLYRRWLGYPKDPNQEHDGQNHHDPAGLPWYDGGDLNEAKYGRLCYPHMFLHNIKNSGLEKGPTRAVSLQW